MYVHTCVCVCVCVRVSLCGVSLLFNVSLFFL
jgi:hypothetical protein